MSEPSPDEIRGWAALITRGGSLEMSRCLAGEQMPWSFEDSIKLAIVRNHNGLPADESDHRGVRAMRVVHAALGENRVAEPNTPNTITRAMPSEPVRSRP